MALSECSPKFIYLSLTPIIINLCSYKLKLEVNKQNDFSQHLLVIPLKRSRARAPEGLLGWLVTNTVDLCIRAADPH